MLERSQKKIIRESTSSNSRYINSKSSMVEWIRDQCLSGPNDSTDIVECSICVSQQFATTRQNQCGMDSRTANAV